KYFAPNTYRGSSRQHDLALRGSGPLPAFPWGQPNLTVGLEHRIARKLDGTLETTYPITVQNSFKSTYYARDSVVSSGYLELMAPLVKANRLPALHSLDLQLSGRSEHYRVDTGTPFEQAFYNRDPPSTSYAAPNLNGQAPIFSQTSYTSRDYTVGLKYQPVSELTLRVSRATGFLPPTPTQLIKEPMKSVSPTFVDDPKTGEQRVPVYTVGGGNPDLKPQ